MIDRISMRSAQVVGYARLLVPVVAVVLVAFALNASWHAIQGSLRQLGAPGELIVALPVALEPAALIYAWVTIDRRRTGRDCGRVRWLLAVALIVAVDLDACAFPRTRPAVRGACDEVGYRADGVPREVEGDRVHAGAPPARAPCQSCLLVFALGAAVAGVTKPLRREGYDVGDRGAQVEQAIRDALRSR